LIASERMKQDGYFGITVGHRPLLKTQKAFRQRIWKQTAAHFRTAGSHPTRTLMDLEYLPGQRSPGLLKQEVCSKFGCELEAKNTRKKSQAVSFGLCSFLFRL
jgi:hypothetical protein